MREFHSALAVGGRSRQGWLRGEPKDRRRGCAQPCPAAIARGLSTGAAGAAVRSRPGLRRSPRRDRPTVPEDSRGYAEHDVGVGAKGQGRSRVPEGRAMTSWPARAVAGLIRMYQLLLRPVMPAACRFEPSCSEYGRQAVLALGLVRGVWLSMRRIGRCHPWNAGGYDPVPVPKGSGPTGPAV